MGFSNDSIQRDLTQDSSDDEDCTFRLHMALIIGRHYLRRAKNRISPY